MKPEVFITRERPEYVMECAVDLAEEGFGDNI